MGSTPRAPRSSLGAVTHLVIRRIEDAFDGAGGRRLFRRAWLPADPERAVVLVHGYAEHSGRYEHVAAWLAARRCAVHAYDHQGHGRSPGRRCHVRRFSDFLDDLERLLDLVRRAHPDRPIVPLGHSMGGLVLATLLCERKPDVAAAVTSGAALALAPDLSRGRMAMARLLRRLLPHLALGSGLDPNGLSRDPRVVQAYLDDPLVYRTMTTSLAAELLATVPRTAAAAGEVRVPMLLLHGEDDALCPVEGSRAFHAALRVPGSALRVYPGLRHEILNEPERETVLQDVLDWMGARSRP